MAALREAGRFRQSQSARRHIKRIYTEISSQPGRMLNDFRKPRLQRAENGKKVFDGHMQWIAAANGINMNYRFSQSAAPSATARTICTSKAGFRSRT